MESARASLKSGSSSLVRPSTKRARTSGTRPRARSGRSSPSRVHSLIASSAERYRRTREIMSQQRIDKLHQVQDLYLGLGALLAHL